jgi:retron-type reverse transcriptase
MKLGNLYAGLTSPASLLAAALTAAQGKRRRPDVARFLMDLELELVRLRRELLDGSYRPGPYRTFEILDPKPRRISAAPFRDRVVHHALTRVLEPIFEQRFLPDSYACRRGLGTHRAIRGAQIAAKRFPFVLKCDIRKYFPSIDHAILMGLLERDIGCPPTLELARTIIDHSNDQEPIYHYFPGDTLFTPYERRRGLPLGNQTSQFFANVYLNPLDHFVRGTLQPGSYFRYVDDFLLFGEDKGKLGEMRRRIEEFLFDYRLSLHPGKSRVYRVRDGVTFLGWRIFPDRSRLVRDNVQRFRARLRDLQQDYAAGRVDWDDVQNAVQAWIAHASHGDTWKLRQQIFDQFPFAPPRRSTEK